MATNSDSSNEDLKLLMLLEARKIKMHEIDKKSSNSNKIRLAFLEKKSGVSLQNIAASILSPAQCDSNIENMIGATQIPVGIAGPVTINGEFAKSSFFVPLATTEGALVASVNRGFSIINNSGGAETVIIKDEQARSILFKADSIKEAKTFSKYIEENFPALKSYGEKDEKFIKITGIETYVVGLNVWLRIKANTSDAMGMNMITFAGKKIADYLIKIYKNIEFISESGNMCTDKKPSAMNIVNSKGKRVIASVELSEKSIKDILKTTSEKLIDMNYRKNLLGSAASGSLGYNAHFANMVAAIFTATGQDIAHVVDGSLGFTAVEKTKKGVNFSVTLTSLNVGTIGGGTGLPTQKECLALLKCQGPGILPGSNSSKLAEIVAVTVLAGEISLLGALCTKELSKAHKAFNR